MKAILIAVAVVSTAALPASAETIRMGEVEVQGHVQKPEVVFIADRPERVESREGIVELRENFLRRIVTDARALATQEAR